MSAFFYPYCPNIKNYVYICNEKNFKIYCYGNNNINLQYKKSGSNEYD